MRKVFRWVYDQLEAGHSKTKIVRRCKSEKRYEKPTKAAFDHLKKLTNFDRKAFSKETIVLGVDEVGRGPLAGPLVAACVQLPYPTRLTLPFLRDSKKLQADEREYLAEQLKEVVEAWSVGVVEAHEFGHELNLHQLTFLAMSRAIEGLLAKGDSPRGLLVDGKFTLPSWDEEQKAVIKGDDTSLSIAAASVIAKVHRDKRMLELDKEYPQYGFAQHVGYGTEAHRKAILEHGPCAQHRANFLVKILAE